MTDGKIDSSIRLDIEQTAPVSPTPAVRGQFSPEEGRGRPGRRPRQAANVEAHEEELSEEELRQDDDRPQHRVDSEA